MSTRSIVLVVAAVLAIMVPSFINAVTVRNAQVRLCEGDNAGLRTTVYKLLTGAKKARAESANTEPGKQQRIDKNAANYYQRLIKGMIVEAAPFPKAPGSPLINCDEVYPKPFPLNLFS